MEVRYLYKTLILSAFVGRFVLFQSMREVSLYTKSEE